MESRSRAVLGEAAALARIEEMGGRMAARQSKAAEAGRERIGAFLQPSNTPEYQRILVEVRERLGASAFDAAWADGRGLTLEQAMAYALEVDRAHG